MHNGHEPDLPDDREYDEYYQSLGYADTPPLKLNGHEPKESQWKIPEVITADEWTAARSSPNNIVEHMLWADVGVLIAPGGTGKTTLFLFKAVHIVLGRTLFGLAITTPGPVVIITSEDEREMLVARLREICRAMALTDQEIQTVRQCVRISDVSGTGLRLTAVYNEVVSVTPAVDDIIAGCLQIKPVLVVIDPAVSFGVGESRVNDAEQGLIEAARRLKRALNCCIIYVHHTGKQSAKDKSGGQYDGRGGSAFADGSRMVFVLVPLSPEEYRQATGDELLPGQNAIKMTRPKLSYCPPQPDIIIRRTGYHFEHVEPSRRDDATDREAAANQIWQLLVNGLTEQRYYTKANLESIGAAGLSRTDLRSAIAWLETSGRIETRPWPVKRHGGATSYLHPI